MNNNATNMGNRQEGNVKLVDLNTDGMIRLLKLVTDEMRIESIVNDTTDKKTRYTMSLYGPIILLTEVFGDNDGIFSLMSPSISDENNCGIVDNGVRAEVDMNPRFNLIRRGYDSNGGQNMRTPNYANPGLRQKSQCTHMCYMILYDIDIFEMKKILVDLPITIDTMSSIIGFDILGISGDRDELLDALTIKTPDYIIFYPSGLVMQSNILNTQNMEIMKNAYRASIDLESYDNNRRY